ncbi:SDR family oxidoreductase [Thermosynechococcus sp. TA-1]|uniref:SDR family oxidoreductase n=1 Tax=Thermosynechococcus sp. TA-1 TaxID=2813673 RepID=UPI001981BCBB|nr:SDR family oxidoreductase [Thermosynechococcus sp. TA-1]QSF49621.1 SDR family oxidoreductase [Thermosynechococcus sp. TA-1]
MKVAVVGATGRTGHRIVSALQASEHQAIAVVRNPAKAQGRWPTVEIRTADVTQPQTLPPALKECEAVICATGASPSLNPLEPLSVDYLGTKNLVDAAKAAHVQQFILVSSLCVSQFFHPLNLFWLILYWKQQAERYLQESGLTYTIVRPGGLKETDDGGFPIIAPADTLFEGIIARSRVAEICVAALGEPSAYNKIFEVVSRPDQTPAAYPELFRSIAAV